MIKKDITKMKIKELLQIGMKELEKSNIEEKHRKCQILLAHMLHVPRNYLYIHEEELVSDEIKELFLEQMEQLKQHIPLQYITHYQEFMKLPFYVDENVLIPQPDTEVLVEEVIKIAKLYPSCHILDLCTGSGAIGISLAIYLDNVQVCLSDISNQALKIANKNARQNQIEEKVRFIKSNMFQDITDKFDIIVSNPPYISSDEILNLEQEVQKEPVLALDGGKDGLEYYSQIAQNAFNYLTQNGYLCLEIGYDQKEKVQEILQDTEKYDPIQCIKDLAGKDRVILTRRR